MLCDRKKLCSLIFHSSCFCVFLTHDHNSNTNSPLVIKVTSLVGLLLFCLLPFRLLLFRLLFRLLLFRLLLFRLLLFHLLLFYLLLFSLMFRLLNIFTSIYAPLLLNLIYQDFAWLFEVLGVFLHGISTDIIWCTNTKIKVCFSWKHFFMGHGIFYSRLNCTLNLITWPSANQMFKIWSGDGALNRLMYT